MTHKCPACNANSSLLVAQWSDWETACASRPDGKMRLAAAKACGVAADAPSLQKCSACGSIYMHPVPQVGQISKFYENYHGTEEFRRKAKHKIRRAFKRLLPFRLLTGGGPLLEIGASIGTASEAARRLGFSPLAQEIDPKAVAEGRRMFPNIPFVQGHLSDVDLALTFSMIYCAEVIEHVPDPIEFARQIYARLKPGGWLFLTTPDVGHTKCPENIIQWGSVKPPEHITLFTKSGLRAVMDEAGLLGASFFPHPKPGIRMVLRKNTKKP